MPQRPQALSLRFILQDTNTFPGASDFKHESVNVETPSTPPIKMDSALAMAVESVSPSKNVRERFRII